jgi:hypothetical protein
MPIESGSRRLSDSPSRGVSDSLSFLLNIQKPSRRVSDSPSRRVSDSPTRRVGEAFFDDENLREFEAKSGTARKLV